MNILVKQIRASVAIGLLVLPAAAFAHHSTTEYDQAIVELEGEIVSVFWRNPHVVLKVVTNTAPTSAATTKGAENVVWTLEGASVSSQRRRGMTADLISVGDQVRVAGPTSTLRANHMVLDHLLLPSGVELLLRGNREPRWPHATLLALTSDIDPAKAAAAEAEGFYRVWTWGRLEPGWWFFGGTENFPLTESALARQAEWNEFVDNPQLDCIAPGMPPTMGNPYPLKFVRTGENIEIRQEEFDVVRTIHMDGVPDAHVPASPLGYSVGHWENDNTLAISTSKINWQYFNRVGVSQSEAVETHERFTLDDEAGQLHYELTVTDPETLTEPYKWKALWVWEPGEVVSEYNCTTDG